MSKSIAVFIIALSFAPAFAGDSSAPESASAMDSRNASAKPAKVKKPKKSDSSALVSGYASAPVPK
ncbi:MAG: hypothetical protein WA071_10110 [Undibacterium umbellatum]|uniref:hypothetical protein n=1 Tax=Undibacterium umbellatum TaxID=2762300 RepID=UPI003BB6E9AF